MTTLETLLKQVEELKGVVNCECPRCGLRFHSGLFAIAAPILVEVIRKLVEQRDRYMGDYSLNVFDKIEKTRNDCNIDLDAIVAKRLGEGSGE